MKYQPSLPEHNDNVSHQHPLKEFFLILSGLLGVALAAFWCLGLLVDVVVDRLSVETEAALNDAVAFQWKKGGNPSHRAKKRCCRCWWTN